MLGLQSCKSIRIIHVIYGIIWKMYRCITMATYGYRDYHCFTFSSCLTLVSNCSAMSCITYIIRLYHLNHSDSK